MKTMFVVIAFGVAVSSGASSAQVPTKPPAAIPSICATIANRLDSLELSLSRNRVAGITDDSAPRATMRAAENTASYAYAQLLVQQAAMNKCPVAAVMFDDIRYVEAAMKCDLASGSDKAQACDSKNWKPNAYKPK